MSYPLFPFMRAIYVDFIPVSISNLCFICLSICMVALTVYYLNLVFNHLLISYHCILQFAWSLNRGCFDNAIEPLLFHIVIGPWIFLHGIVKRKCGFFGHYFMWDPSTNYILIMWLDHYYPYLVIQPVILLHGTLAIILRGFTVIIVLSSYENIDVIHI